MKSRINQAEARGDADAYYSRPPEPHIWLDLLGRERISEADMSPEEVAAYLRGYRENLSGEKDWR